MSRGITAAMITALSADTLRLRLFVEIQFATGTVNVWNGAGDKSWDSKTWQGVGAFGAIKFPAETGALQAENFTLELLANTQDLVGSQDALELAINEMRHSKTATVWVGALDENRNVIADPILVGKGFTDVGRVEESGGLVRLTINVENELARLREPIERRYTPEDQEAEFPGDKGFSFVSELQEPNVPLFYGAGPYGGSAGGGGGDGAGQRSPRVR